MAEGRSVGVEAPPRAAPFPLPGTAPEWGPEGASTHALALMLGLAFLTWLLGLSVLAARAALPSAPGADAGPAPFGHVWHGVVPLVAGVLLQLGLPHGPARRQLVAAAVALVAWLCVSAAAVWGLPPLGTPAPWGVQGLALQVPGLAAGLLIGAALAHRVSAGVTRVLQRSVAVIAAIVLLATAALVLVPVAGSVRLGALDKAWSGWPGGYGKAVLAQVYALLKAAILWVPLGLATGVGGRRKAGAAGAAMALLALALLGLTSVLGGLRIGDLLEVLGASWGFLAGLVLGDTLLRDLRDLGGIGALAPTPALPAAETPVAAGVVVKAASIDAANAPRPVARVTVRRLLAIVVLGACAAWAWSFPRFGPALLVAAAAYVALLVWRRHAWLLVVPAALPLLALAPWTGRFFFDEFDLLMLATVAAALWHERNSAAAPPWPTTLRLGALAFVASSAVSLAVGLVPLPPLDANAFNNYWSPYNALQVGRGLFWAVVFAWLLRRQGGPGTSHATALVTRGMLVGLAGVVAVGLWERWQFAGTFDLGARYRITATFVSMHTGGSEIETYLALALPFAWLVTARGHRPALRAAGWLLLLLGAWLAALTIARGAIAATAVVIAILGVASWRARPAAGRGPAIAPGLALAAAAAVLALGFGGSYLQSRMASLAEDWQTRVSHWSAALDLRDPDVATGIFGMGTGRFPAEYLQRAVGEQTPGNYRIGFDHGNPYLSLAGAEVLYMAQRVPVTAHQRYTLTLRARSSGTGARLGVPVCEKHLLDSRSCAWNVQSVEGSGQWQTLRLAIDSGSVGAGSTLVRRPVELALFKDAGSAPIDVDDVDLRDGSGRALIGNGDFAAGLDRWFFKTHSHLPWHIKNLWVSLLFEQGWVGVIAFGFAVAALAALLVRRTWQGDRFAAALLAALAGTLTIGWIGSPLDTPRIAMLIYLLAPLGALTGTGRRAAT